MAQINIVKKIQLLTLITIISSIFIFVYVDSAFAFEPRIAAEDMEKCLNGELSEYGWCKDYRIEQNYEEKTGYEESENTKLARDRLNESDQIFSGPGSTLFDKPEFSYGLVGLVAVIGTIAFLFLFKKK